MLPHKIPLPEHWRCMTIALLLKGVYLANMIKDLERGSSSGIIQVG
jgi:hypothetical protein